MFRLFFAFVLVLSTSFQHANAADATPPDSNDKKYGKNLVAEFDIDAETIRKFQAHKASKKDPNESALINTLLADTEDWTGKSIPVDSQKNPHTIVVTLSATADSDGDALSMWQAGWLDSEGITRVNALPGLTKSGVKAGESIIVTAASPPISFQSNAEFSPVLSFVKQSNMSIKSVHVQIWSGVASASPLEWFFAMRWIMVGLVMFLLWWIFIRKA